jgi:hypothetical protein
MDPASLALSVATVLETAIKLVEILHDIKEGGKQRIRLSAEISSLWLVLENVKNQLDELSTSASQVPTSYLRSLSLPDGPLSQCSELLNTLYEKCTPKTGPSRVLQTLKWSFDKDEVDRYLLIVHRLQTSISLSIAQTSLAVLSNVAADTSATRHALESHQLQQLHNWLSPLDFEAQQRQTSSDWCPGTVKWVLDLTEYRAFKRSENPYLWCPAPAGCGKTVLSSVIINDLRTTFPASGPVAVLGVYLTARSTTKDECLSSEIFGSLLRQVCSLGHGPDDELLAAFRSGHESNTALSAEDAMNHLKRLIAPLKQTYLVVDAIDELKPHRRRIQLTQNLKDLSASVSIFMTGRPYDELGKLCAPLHHICDVCDAERQTGLYHCEHHLDGGWDACASCFAKGHTHCPTPTHADPTYLPCQILIWFHPLREDIELYVQQRIQDDDHLDVLLRGKESLKKQLVEKIVRESDER